MWGQRTTTACRCSLLFIAGFTGKKGVCRIKRTKCLVLLSCWKIKLLAVTCFPDGAAKSDRWKYDHRKVLFWPGLQDHWLEISPKPWQSPHLALQMSVDTHCLLYLLCAYWWRFQPETLNVNSSEEQLLKTSIKRTCFTRNSGSLESKYKAITCVFFFFISVILLVFFLLISLIWS